MEAEEKEQLIQEVIERVFKILPETIGNLMKTYSMHQKMTEEFYAKNKEFKDHTDIVREVIAKIDGRNPLENYDRILTNAIPEIREQIKLKSGLSNAIPSRESLTLTDNGAL